MWYIVYNGIASRAAERLRTKNPRKLGNIRNVPKPHGTITQRPAPPRQNKKFASTSKRAQKNSDQTRPAVRHPSRKLEPVPNIPQPIPPKPETSRRL